jgi:hypothetical protein
MGIALLVDDAATTNSALQGVTLGSAGDVSGPSQTVNLPPGFSISTIAAGLGRPRFMTFDAAGNLLVAAQSGAVYRFAASGDGGVIPAASPPAPLVDNLNGPSSVAIDGGYLYVGETQQVSRYPYDPFGEAGPQEVVVPGLPTGGHSTRTIAFGPDGSLFVSVGSSCNICAERDQRRAAILRYASDGANGEIFAWGLRNAVGVVFNPWTGRLWATVNERDNQGNEIPPDLVTVVGSGQNGGYPGSFRPARPCLLHRLDLPRQLPGRPDRRATWVLEPRAPGRPKAAAHPLRGRPAGQRRGLRDRLAARGWQPLGAPRGRHRRTRRQPHRLGRYGRAPLPNHLHGLRRHRAHPITRRLRVSLLAERGSMDAIGQGGM